jgi:hypothetical protein
MTADGESAGYVVHLEYVREERRVGLLGDTLRVDEGLVEIQHQSLHVCILISSLEFNPLEVRLLLLRDLLTIF